MNGCAHHTQKSNLRFGHLALCSLLQELEECFELEMHPMVVSLDQWVVVRDAGVMIHPSVALRDACVYCKRSIRQDRDPRSLVRARRGTNERCETFLLSLYISNRRMDCGRQRRLVELAGLKCFPQVFGRRSNKR